MTEDVYNVTDLGPGDGGKGGVVHKIAHMLRAHTIIKEGGANGSHGISTSRGERFAFTQWGCGTFEGIKTHISSLMVISPTMMQKEAEALRYRFGIHNVFDLLTIDERALCSTPYHGIASRLKELALGDNPRGTIGTGVGVAYRYSQWFPELSIRASNLLKPNLKERLAAVREKAMEDLAVIVKGDFLLADQDQARKEIFHLYDDKFLDFITERIQETSRQMRIVDAEYLGREILSQDGVAIVERSHGVLTDHFYGFHPHTSALRRLPCFTEAMLREAGYNGRIINIGVRRAYEIRHGAGPMPTDDPLMAETLLPGSTKEDDRYQGKARIGPIDLNLFRYAIEVCGGPAAFDGLAITWFDQIRNNGVWYICDRYDGADDRTYFSPSGGIKVRRGEDAQQLEYQEALGKQLSGCTPEITTYVIPSDAERDNLYSLCADVLKEKVGVPVRMVSFGPTERDKMCK